MKILFLIFSFNTGGIERLLIDMCNTMVSEGHNITLCVINKDYELSLFDELDSKVTRLLLNRPMKHGKKLPYMIKFARIVLRNKYDILHCQGLNCVLFSLLAKLSFPHIKLINTVHDVNNFPRYSKIQIFFHNMLCSHIIAISETVRQEILMRGTKPQQVTTIYNAIDTNRFCLCDHPHIIHGKPQYISPDSKIVIGNVARIMPEKKGQMVLLEAIYLLKDTYPKLHCMFAGDIAPKHEQQYQEFVDYIHCHQFDKHVTFLGNVKNIPDFLKKLDLFILPSFYEGFGIALIEALSTGLPCIASNLDGPAEILSSHSRGLLFTPGNAKELAACINDILKNYTNYNPCIISQNIAAKYSIQVLVDQHLDIYQKCHTKIKKAVTK